MTSAFLKGLRGQGDNPGLKDWLNRLKAQADIETGHQSLCEGRGGRRYGDHILVQVLQRAYQVADLSYGYFTGPSGHATEPNIGPLHW
jgi:hypothetical protein